MSRRTHPRIIGTAFLAAALMNFPSPTATGAPNPWRGSAVETAPPSRVIAAPCEVDVEINSFYTDDPTYRPPLIVLGPPVPVSRTRISFTPSPQTPSGTWCREMPGMTATLAFASGELTATIVANDEGTVATLTLTAEYSIAKDGTVHGIVTGADGAAGGRTDGAEIDWVGLSMVLQQLVDQPFAFRCRPTDGGMMMSNLRIAPSDPSYRQGSGC